MEPNKRIQRKLVDAQRIIGYLISSYEDYVSARILFNNNKLIPACCLANTSIEKYFKALVDFKGNSIKARHDLLKLFPTIKDFDIELYEKLNIEFLSLLTKIYETRYIGDCSPGFNFVILRNKFLAELDYTYSILEPRIRIKKFGNENNDKTIYEADIKIKSKPLWENNYILNEIQKQKFIESTDYVHELRIIEADSQLIQCSYHTNHSKNDGKFNYQGLVIKEENKSFQMSHLPMKPK